MYKRSTDKINEANILYFFSVKFMMYLTQVINIPLDGFL